MRKKDLRDWETGTLDSNVRAIRHKGNIGQNCIWVCFFVFFLWGPYEIVEIVNRIDYTFDVNGVVNPFHANMLKQYVDRQNVVSHCLMSAEAIA